MAEDDSKLEETRIVLIQLLEAEQYRLTEVARTTGRVWFKAFFDYPTECHLITHVLKLLDENLVPLRSVLMGEPPGSGGIAYRVIDPAFRELYIKVKIEDGTAWILSFKRSDHTSGKHL